MNGWRQNYDILPGSFIHVDDFQNMSKLADYLTYLSSNETALLEYHKWRRIYEAGLFDKNKTSRCELCQKVLEKIESFEKTGMINNSVMIKNLDKEMRHLQSCGPWTKLYKMSEFILNHI